MCYLVRRLLENGANSNFVHQIHDNSIDIGDIIKNPIFETQKTQGAPHPKVANIANLYQPYRENSSGRDLTNEPEIEKLSNAIKKVESLQIKIEPTSDQNLLKALDRAIEDYPMWARRSVDERSACLENLARLLENNYEHLLNLLVTEAHKTFPDAIAEVREAIDFCYYYAKRAVELMAQPVQLPSPTGEFNHLHYHGRGVFVCISPWNFPLAIFLGQVLAAVVTGNTVIAKPAEVTPKIAAFAVSLAHQAGIPKFVLQLVITKGSTLSQHILQDPRVTGVSFTGSTEVALSINRTLAARHAPIASFIAETGGMNAMIVDSSALPEQVVNDVIISAFQSAGQRCSALRILCVQEEVADTIQEMLVGAMKELKIGDPSILSTDVGPVIDKRAQEGLIEYLTELSYNPNAKLVYQCDTPENTESMHFIAPQLWEVKSIKDVTREAFGPIVHMIRYRAELLDHLIDEINSTNYGLTFGLHTRLESTMQQVENRIRAGNVYINRSMIGAVVGVQPFGGEGFSGTGFKAGGPNYLLRFVHERTITNDVTAVGGNASLLAEV
jgi:RHH-type proline utilization regulon transcriptional repressor/proline dehydrogenase/delta 1-pyrroline-5-carboxylate dehydrogenase